MNARVAGPEADLPWTTELVPGVLTIGNPFPEIPLQSQVLGASWGGVPIGKPAIVYLHSYFDALDDDPSSPLNAIRTFARTYTDQASKYHLLVMLTNFKMEPLALEMVANAFDGSDSVSVTYDAAGFTQLGLIEPSADTGIPKVFLVGEDGIIDWIGNAEDVPDVLSAMAAGKFDRRAAHEAYEARVAERRPQVIAKYQFTEAMKLGDYDRASEVADERLAKLPNDSFWLAMKYQALLKAERHSAINAVLKAMSEDYNDDAEWLAETAFNIAEGKAGDDLDLALEFATRANELTGESRVEMMHALAVVHGKREEFEQAVIWEEKVIANIEDKGKSMGLDKVLAEFREKLAEQSKAATPDEDRPQ